MAAERGPAGERGAVTVLAIGFLLVCLLLVVVVADTAKVFLVKRDLAAIADGAALAASDALRAEAVYGGDAGDLRLDADRAGAQVAAYLDRVGFADRARYPQASYRVAVGPGGRAVTVTLFAAAALPFVDDVTGGRSRVGVVAHATAMLARGTP